MAQRLGDKPMSPTEQVAVVQSVGDRLRAVGCCLTHGVFLDSGSSLRSSSARVRAQQPQSFERRLVVDGFLLEVY